MTTWRERRTLYRRELIVQEGRNDSLAVRLTPNGMTVPGAWVFTSAKATPATTTLAVFAALERSAP